MVRRPPLPVGRDRDRGRGAGRAGGGCRRRVYRLADASYKRAIVEGRAGDIVYTDLFTGVHGNYLRRSIERAGLDPDKLPGSDPGAMDFGGGAAKAWRDIWGSGQGIGAVEAVVPAAALVDRLAHEYAAARASLG